jgi:regulator of protease activity HflC (stomatin/prohibitin superfamily)
MTRTRISLAVTGLACALVAYETFQWTINRVYVPVGYSLLLRYKGPLIFAAPRAGEGRFAVRSKSGALEVGILEQMPGPGRHFYCPIWWERKLVPDIEVGPNEIGLVTSKLGEPLPPGQFLVDGDIGEVKHAGVLRKVYGPGRYRVNPYGYDFKVVQQLRADKTYGGKHHGWVEIPTGYVGVVTNLTNNKATGAIVGIQAKVLQPGIYLVNPREQQIDIILVGFYEKTISTNLLTDSAGKILLDESGEPQVAKDSSGISFPSADGFNMHIDFTAIWGVMPNQAANAIKNFGNLEAVESKIVVPQIESIVRNQGSHYGAPQLLAGDSREDFQKRISSAFSEALKEKNLSLLSGLVRYIYVPNRIRVPIQQANLANELKLTSEQKELTAKTEGILREAEKNVDLAAATVRVETDRKLAKLKADATKKAAETDAETQRRLAEVDRKTAELDRQATIAMGEATADAQKLMEEAKAGKFKLAVSAFGTASAYTQWQFAKGLPEEVKLQMLYAGPGTLWTDLKGFTETLLAREAQAGEEARAKEASAQKK